MKLDLDLASFDPHISGNVNDVAKDVTGLGIGIAPHPPRQQAVEAAGDDEQGHVEINFQADRRREGVQVEETDSIREGIFDQHPVGITRDQLFG